MKVPNLQFLRLTAMVLLTVAVVSCGGKKKDKAPALAKETLKADLEEIAYPLPSPFELTELINKIEASYIIGITNDVKAYNKYLTPQKQALNLGVYSSDMAYATTYHRTEVTQEYLASVIELVKELDLTGAVDKDTPEKIEESLDSKEKSVEVITDLIYSAYSYMNRNNDTELSYLILAGTWVEGMYLATNVSENTMENLEILKIIVKQEESLTKILDMMAEYKENVNIQPIYNKLLEIKKVYAIEEGSDAITIEEMKVIVEKVAAMRAEIIE